MKMIPQALNITGPGVGSTLALKQDRGKLQPNFYGTNIFPLYQSKVNPIGPVTCSLLVQSVLYCGASSDVNGDYSPVRESGPPQQSTFPGRSIHRDSGFRKCPPKLKATDLGTRKSKRLCRGTFQAHYPKREIMAALWINFWSVVRLNDSHRTEIKRRCRQSRRGLAVPDVTKAGKKFCIVKGTTKAHCPIQPCKGTDEKGDPSTLARLDTDEGKGLNRL